MSAQDQYTDTIRHTQENWTSMIASWTDNVSKAFGATVNPLTNVDPNVAIDQFFDFSSKTLDMQRELAKQFVGATVSATEKMRSQVESLTNAAHDEV